MKEDSINGIYDTLK